MLIRAVVFDLDDTLYPQADWLTGAWGAVAGAAPDAIDRVVLRAALHDIAAQGSDRGSIIDRALLRVSGEHVDTRPLVQAFHEHAPTTLTPYDGAPDALVALRQRVPIGLVTDGEPRGQRAKLTALGLTDAFDAIVFSDEAGREFRKPHPAPFLRAADALGVEPGVCVFVGDRPDKDVDGARAAGFAGTVRVRSGEYAAVPDPADCLASVDTVVDAVRWITGQLPLVGSAGQIVRHGSAGGPAAGRTDEQGEDEQTHHGFGDRPVARHGR